MKASDSRNLLLTLPLLYGHQMFVHRTLLDQGVQHVQDAVAAPDLVRVREHSELVLGLRLGLGTPDTEGLKLVDKLVDDVPEPLFRELEVDGTFRVCGVVMVSVE
jgi:hypothetical protein